ncbi:TraR/DksA C4-type zinc finger protein [Ferrimonas balearica]|uniref:TraR/DksA C4-type zinc finger protein n=1 Tax=Ferrimonas balearica TaxID=44012 RepID=UPI001C93E660|nr:TraR/DksA C4-type zinc finger protein [Ferrimonas balearica]
MTDIIDHATELETQQRQDALEHALARAHPSPRQGTELCQDCAQPIPLARRQALPHTQRCIDCQQRQEQRGAHAR